MSLSKIAPARLWFMAVLLVAFAVPASAASRADVRAIQAILNDLGYQAGAPDGLMGRKTRAAIRAYQGDEGLLQDGRPSRELRGLLSRAIPARVLFAARARFLKRLSSFLTNHAGACEESEAPWTAADSFRLIIPALTSSLPLAVKFSAPTFGRMVPKRPSKSLTWTLRITSHSPRLRKWLLRIKPTASSTIAIQSPKASWTRQRPSWLTASTFTRVVLCQVTN